LLSDGEISHNKLHVCAAAEIVSPANAKQEADFAQRTFCNFEEKCENFSFDANGVRAFSLIKFCISQHDTQIWFTV